MSAPNLIAAIVGQATIYGEHPTETRVVLNANDEPVIAPAIKIYGPGETLWLEASEVKRLRASGHLVDPERFSETGVEAAVDPVTADV